MHLQKLSNFWGAYQNGAAEMFFDKERRRGKKEALGIKNGAL